MSAFSFHETKNLTSGGEGGVLVVNNPDLVNKAVVARDKGTNRANFLDGKVDKYSWVSQGSSYLMNEISAAWLWAQLQQLDLITDRRRSLNNNYRKMLENLVDDGNFEIQSRPDHATPNGHIFYLKTRTADERIRLLNKLAERGIHATFHYVPLHSSPAGLRFGRFSGTDSCTSSGAERLIRLPLFHNMSDAQQSMVIDAVNCACS